MDHQPRIPRLCATGCGFFGTLATQNLCSKCYNDFLEEEKELAMSFFENLPPIKCPRPNFKLLGTNPFPCFRILSDATQTSTAEGEQNTKDSTAKKNRCHSCNKKIGFLGFACRCGESFCSIHRYPETHKCTFDYKTAGRIALAKENPVCKADKMQNRL